ncbi:MAG: hypothetical protein KAI33_00265, partial [Elusimicrobiales bacterium]|nr:hypothetical protein [Elusimicrobiales bacterium]
SYENIPFKSDKEDFKPISKEFVSADSASKLSPGMEINSKINEQLDLQKAMRASRDILPASSSVTVQANNMEIASGQMKSSQERRKISYFEPKSDRDPTLSSAEYAQIKAEIEAKKERARRRRLEELRKKKRNRIQNKLILQGIVGNNVIINGEMYSVGDYVKGVRIIKIGTDYFIGYHKGKKFKKIMR